MQQFQALRQYWSDQGKFEQWVSLHFKITFLLHDEYSKVIDAHADFIFGIHGLVLMLIGLQLPVIVQQSGNTGLWDAIKYSLIIALTLLVSRLNLPEPSLALTGEGFLWILSKPTE
ncbi:MAG: hypothetical protein WKF97_24860 [Chitinophagaceae bacterium]